MKTKQTHSEMQMGLFTKQLAYSIVIYLSKLTRCRKHLSLDLAR